MRCVKANLQLFDFFYILFFCFDSVGTSSLTAEENVQLNTFVISANVIEPEHSTTVNTQLILERFERPASRHSQRMSSFGLFVCFSKKHREKNGMSRGSENELCS